MMHPRSVAALSMNFGSGDFGRWFPRAALLLLFSFCFAPPAAALDCDELQFRVYMYAAETREEGGTIREETEPGKPPVFYRFDASGRKIRLITLTPELSDCLKNTLAQLVTLVRASQINPERKTRRPTLGIPAQARFEEQEFDIGDLNGDGLIDGVGISNGDNLFVFLGNNTEVLTVGGNFPVGGTPQRVMLADVNGDLRQDAIVTRIAGGGGDQGGVSILLGNGDGTLQDAVPSAAGNNPAALTSGDFNADGKLDLATAFRGDFATADSAGIAVLLGNGDGSFQSPSMLSSANGVSAILAADLTGDGKEDLALGNNQTNTITVFPGDGAGAFGAGVPNEIGAGPEYLASMDLNQDGMVDLVSQMSSLNGLSIHYGNGDGGFQAAQRMLAGGSANSFAALDVNDDGSLTAFFVPGPGSDLSIAGVFSDGRVAGQPMYEAPSKVSDITVGDFNKDGRPDLATAGLGDSTSDVAVLLSRPGGGFQQGPKFRIGSSPTGVAGGDFNGDGNADLAVAPASQPGRIELLLGDGTGGFQNPLSTPVLGGLRQIAAGDFNGDGRTDLAASIRPSSGPGSVSILLGGISGSLAASGTLAAGNRPLFAEAGDLDADGFADLAVVDGGTLASESDPGGIFVFLGKGDGTFASGVRYGGGLNPSSVAIGDVNHDGLPDLAITTTAANFNSQFGVLLGQGGGAFNEPVLENVRFGPNHVVIEDFDQDGKNDLLVTHCCGDVSPAVLRGKGDGTFGEEEFFAAPGDASRAVAAQFNEDGFPDVAFGAGANISGGGGVGVLLNLLSPAGPQRVTSVNGAGFQAGAPVAPDSIVSAFGAGLATGIDNATSLPLPTVLLGTSVRVTDSQGTSRDAGLFAVTPGQLNLLLPPGTASGPATITVNSATSAVVSGVVQVAAVAPGIFQANPTDLAVGSVLRIQPGDVRTETGLVLFENDRFVAQPIDMGDESDQIFLILFGTGIRGRNMEVSVTALVDGEPATVTFADDQMQFAGLDQVVMQLPRSLLGRGLVDVVITVDGKTANIVKVNFQ